MWRSIAALMLPLMAAPAAAAEELRPLCIDRPGLGTPACTIDHHHAAIELGLIDWTLQNDSATRTDTIVAGDVLLRYGLGQQLEAQLGWTAYGHVRKRERTNDTTRGVSRTGDMTVAIRRNLVHPDGSGFSIALMPRASLPVGQTPLGAGDWGAGLLIPMSVALSDTLSLATTPEVDAAVDRDGNGRHAAYAAVLGLGIALTEAIGATAEVSAFHDDDPAGAATTTLAGLCFAWQPRADLQLDVGSVVGLHDAPDVELLLGIAQRF